MSAKQKTRGQLQGEIEELRARLDRWIHETGDRGAAPEGPDAVAYWRARGGEYLEQGLKRRGLSPDITPEEHLAYWERTLTPTRRQEKPGP